MSRMAAQGKVQSHGTGLEPSLLCANQLATVPPLMVWLQLGVISLGNGSAADKSWAPCPRWHRTRVVQEPLRFITTPGVHSPIPKTIRKGPGRESWKGRM